MVARSTSTPPAATCWATVASNTACSPFCPSAGRFGHNLAAVADPAPVDTLPARSYLDPDQYAVEVEALFHRGWVPVCRVDRIPRHGDRYATTIGDRPVVAVRDGEDVRVLSNVCRHRWSLVAEAGCSHGRNLVCPYHQWSYALDGHLQAAPLAGAFTLDGVALPTVRHEVWEGFVMANLDGDAEPLGPQLAGLSERLAPWRLGELVTVGSRTFTSTWNWKVMVENWIECYHHIGAHRQTVEPFQPARSTRIADAAGAPWTFMTVDTAEEVIGEPEERSPGLSSEDAELLTIWAAFPFLLGGTQARFSFWLEITPHLVDHHAVTWHVLVHPDLLERWPPDGVEGVLDLLATVHEEDMASCARVDEGLRSATMETGLLVALETPIVDFHTWWRERMAG